MGFHGTVGNRTLIFDRDLKNNKLSIIKIFVYLNKIKVLFLC